MRGESNPGDDPNKIICKYTTGAESSYEPKCLQTGLYWNKYWNKYVAEAIKPNSTWIE